MVCSFKNPPFASVIYFFKSDSFVDSIGVVGIDSIMKFRSYSFFIVVIAIEKLEYK